MYGVDKRRLYLLVECSKIMYQNKGVKSTLLESTLLKKNEFVEQKSTQFLPLFLKK